MVKTLPAASSDNPRSHDPVDLEGGETMDTLAIEVQKFIAWYKSANWAASNIEDVYADYVYELYALCTSKAEHDLVKVILDEFCPL